MQLFAFTVTYYSFVFLAFLEYSKQISLLHNFSKQSFFEFKSTSKTSSNYENIPFNIVSFLQIRVFVNICIAKALYLTSRSQVTPFGVLEKPNFSSKYHNSLPPQEHEKCFIIGSKPYSETISVNPNLKKIV